MNLLINYNRLGKKIISQLSSRDERNRLKILYNNYKDENYNSDKLEEQVIKLMMDDDATNKKSGKKFVLIAKDIMK